MLKKIISLVISASLIVTLAPTNGFSMPAKAAADIQSFIPSSLGKITSSKIFDDDNIIINIQDLHCHPETQKKIASIIEYLDTKYGLDKVYLEGAFGSIDTAWLSDLNKDKIGSQVIENLLNSGRLSGTEFYSALKNKKNFVAGIENEQLYKENIKLLGEIIEISPEIEAICNNLEKEINSVKKDYSSPLAKKLQKIINSYDNGKIKSKKFYSELIKIAKNLNLSISKYPNLSLYISVVYKTEDINNSKVSGEFARFVSELRGRLSYKEYSVLLDKSNNFINFENIYYDLMKFNNEFQITKILKLKNLDELFNYLKINGQINPIDLVKEKEEFINELYVNAGRTKYEKEVSFLSEFIPVLKKYFTAEISADEYYNFEQNYDRFRTTWTSYMSEKTVKELDKYYELLSRYHRNNILRDSIFTNTLIPAVAVSRSPYIHTSIHPYLNFFSSAKKITLVVTGGFHTRGLEKIFEKQKVSYAIITPKITSPVEQAKQLYNDSISYYSTILKNTINLEPLSQEPINVSFPKVLTGIFSLAQSDTLKGYSDNDLQNEIKKFIETRIIEKQDSFYGNVEILNWGILSSEIKNGNVELFVEYKDYGNKETVSRVNYVYSDGDIINYADIDRERTLSMVQRIKGSKFAKPSIELEPTTSARKKIYKHILLPLKEVSGDLVSLMPYKQVHMTIGYDSSDITPEQMDQAVQTRDKSHPIFEAVGILNKSFANNKTSMAGTLKLMPDGVLIYEITDRDLIAQMLNLRENFVNINPNYKTPSIVHMTIGRIFDESILQDTPQSKQQLSDLLKKLNEKIYEINKAAELSKIKTSFTLKAGFVSSTGDKDYLTTRLYSENQSLVVFKNLFKNANDKINFIYKVVVAPIFEEFIFREVPFIFTGLAVSNPVSIIPALVTAFTGIFVFSYSHTLSDKISGSKEVRNWKDFLSPSTSLTWLYLVLSFVFPQNIFVAPAVTIVLHSAKNFMAFTRDNDAGMLSVVKGEKSKKDKKDKKDKKENKGKKKNEQADEAAVPVIEQNTVDRVIEVLSLLNVFNDNETKQIVDDLSNLPENAEERYDIVKEQIDALLELVRKNNRAGYQPQYKIENRFGGVSEGLDKLKDFCEKIGIYNWGSFYMSDFLLYALLQFSSIADMDNPDRTLLYYITDSLFVKDNLTDKRDSVAVLRDISATIKFTYNVDNRDFIPYCVDKLLEDDILNADEKIPYNFKDCLINYDVLKQYYFTISKYKEVDKEMSQGLLSSMEQFNENVMPLIIDEQNREKMSEILANIEELAGKINERNIMLLEDLLYDLTDIIVSLDKQQREKAAFYLLPFFVAYSNLKNEGTRKTDVMLNKLVSLSFDFYDINSDNKNFYEMLSGLADIAGRFYVSKERDVRDYGKTIYNSILQKVFLDIYKPIAESGVDKNSQEYKIREKTFYDVFKILSEQNPEDISIYGYLFAVSSFKGIYGPGLNKKTLELFIDSVRRAGFTNARIPVPENITFISDIDEVTDLIIKNVDVFDLLYFCKDLLEKDELGKNFIVKIIESLLTLSKNANINKKFKKAVVAELIKLASSELYMSLQEYNFFDIDELNKLCKENNIPVYLKLAANSYMEMVVDMRGRRYLADTRGEYRFTQLLKYLPKNIFGFIHGSIQEPPILYQINGQTEKDDDEVKTIRDKFNTLQSILNDNNIALSLLNGLSASKTKEKDFEELAQTLANMIKSLSLINPDHGSAAQVALDSIMQKMSYDDGRTKTPILDPRKIKQQMLIKHWTEDTLAEITEIHTLINAVHQTSISDFKDAIKDISKIGNKSIKTVLASHENPSSSGTERVGVQVYDLSENKLNSDIIDFIGRLSQMKLPYPRTEAGSKNQINDFICMDNFLVWTTRLFVHSVDVFMNFSETDKGITVVFHEGGRTLGNSERVKYFSTVLEKFGFSVDADTRQASGSDDGVCSLKATLNANYGLSEYTDFIDVATKVVSLFKYSDMLDWELENYANRYSETSYRDTFNSVVEKFMAGDMWYGYSPGSTEGWPNGNLTAFPQRNSLQYVDRDAFKEILKYLELDYSFFEIHGKDIKQKDLDKYFNYAIERSFAVGRIVLNENGVLVRNENYDVISHLAETIQLDEADALNKSHLINLIQEKTFKFKTVGYIGDLMAVSGYLRLSNGNYLSVKGLINPVTKRMKYSDIEYVSTQGRRNVDFAELFEILQKEGYDINIQQPLSPSEQQRINSLLSLRTQNIDSPEIRAVPTSSGNGTYVAGYITFDKNKVDENSIFVAPYTTPDDVESIKTAKAIITTSGGVLSHAAITTREYKTPSVIINGARWSDKGLDILYCSPEGKSFVSEGFHIQKVEEKNKILKEGSIVLINGETGHVLLFDEINMEILESLQDCIYTDNARRIRAILSENIDSKDINKLVEYVYFQTIGDSRMPKTLDMLFSRDMPDVIKEKIKELNESYIQHKIRSMNNAVENLETITNPNMAYSIVRTLIDKLEFIKTPDKRQEFDFLREEVNEMAQKAKDNMLLFLQSFFEQCMLLDSKERLSDEDIEKIFYIVQLAHVYEMFVAQDEERQDLIYIKSDIKNIVDSLTTKLQFFAENRHDGKGKILSFADIKRSDVYIFGSKTTELASMKKLLEQEQDVIVPDGVGISFNVLADFFEAVGKKKEFSMLMISFKNAVQNGEYLLAKDFANLIVDLLEDTKDKISETETLRSKLETVVLKTLGDTKYSVRSSGVGEDSATNAFAGMGETILNVSKENLFEALIDCWKSFYSERSVQYMVNSKLVVYPAVLIQEMIDVDKSGVAFTRDKYGNTTIETLYGQGEGIVSGKLTPDTITVNLESGDVLEYSVATKDYKISPTTEGVKTVAVDKGAKERTLNYKEIEKLVDVLRKLEQDVFYAVDVEFGCKDGKLYIFQRRPVTTNVANKEIQENNDTIEYDTEIKYNISLSAGIVSEETEFFAYIPNPINNNVAIPVYLKSRGKASAEFVVPSEYNDSLVIHILGIYLTNRINSDMVLLSKLNGGVLSYMPGEIGLMPPTSNVDVSGFEHDTQINTDNIRNMLSAA